jgi:SagB-type dehydrogenase family enzyme
VAVGVRVRRSRFLVTHWDDDAHWVYNFLSRTRRRCSTPEFAILQAAGHWVDADGLRVAVGGEDGADLSAAIDALLTDQLLDSTDCQPSATAKALAAWGRWNPVAGFFHAETRTMGTIDPDAEPSRPTLLRLRAIPPALKEYAGLPRTELPGGSNMGPLQDVLQQRRTWREFSEQPLSLDETATLLRQTFGVQRWLDAGDNHWVALKTSPSGGARHSIEAYVIAFAVEGVENGTYHYCPDSHALTQLGSEASRDLLRTFLPQQTGFHDPAALIVMTSVFARMQAKYPHPHAYKVVLLDAGHLGQTFALVATALGLAPFCTAHVNAPRIEEHLGIDGVSESVVMCLGVGRRPDGKNWAPQHDHSAGPATRPPEWASRLAAPPFP